jgi:hypothetical protein
LTALTHYSVTITLSETQAQLIVVDWELISDRRAAPKRATPALVAAAVVMLTSVSRRARKRRTAGVERAWLPFTCRAS